MKDIQYKSLIFDKDEIIKLYLDNEWTNYTKDKDSLFKGIKNSLYVYAAYQADRLVGLIRVVGDGFTIVYIQDILVLTSFQRKGIGKKLVKDVLKKYENVRQISLTTDLTDKQKSFYESCGFKAYSDIKLSGYIFDK